MTLSPGDRIQAAIRLTPDWLACASSVDRTRTEFGQRLPGLPQHDTHTGADLYHVATPVQLLARQQHRDTPAEGHRLIQLVTLQKDGDQMIIVACGDVAAAGLAEYLAPDEAHRMIDRRFTVTPSNRLQVIDAHQDQRELVSPGTIIARDQCGYHLIRMAPRVQAADSIARGTGRGYLTAPEKHQGGRQHRHRGDDGQRTRDAVRPTATRPGGRMVTEEPPPGQETRNPDGDHRG